MTAPANRLPGFPSMPRSMGNHEARIRALERQVFPRIHFVRATGVASQTISSGTSFTTVEFTNLLIPPSSLAYFGIAGATEADFAIHCYKQGLYYAECRVNEVVATGVGSHENRGYPRDLTIDYPLGAPNFIQPRVPGGGTPDDTAEPVEGSFVGWIAGVNATTSPPSPGGGTREIVSIHRAFFSLNDDDDSFVVNWQYRQVTGFDQTIGTCRGFIMYLPSDADSEEFAVWEQQDY